MQIEVPDQVVDALREALAPVLERLIDEKVEQKRPLLLSVKQVATELSCSRSSVYGLIHGGHLEAVCIGKSYYVSTAILLAYVEELTRPKYQRDVVTVRSDRARPSKRTTSDHKNEDRKMRTTVVTATKPPRAPRQKPKKISKQEIADSRCTVDELAERWWGEESATALLRLSEIELSSSADAPASFRYGDLIEWVEQNKDGFSQWLEAFDPILKRGTDDGAVTQAGELGEST